MMSQLRFYITVTCLVVATYLLIRASDRMVTIFEDYVSWSAQEVTVPEYNFDNNTYPAFLHKQIADLEHDFFVFLEYCGAVARGMFLAELAGLLMAFLYALHYVTGIAFDLMGPINPGDMWILISMIIYLWLAYKVLGRLYKLRFMAFLFLLWWFNPWQRTFGVSAQMANSTTPSVNATAPSHVPIIPREFRNLAVAATAVLLLVTILLAITLLGKLWSGVHMWRVWLRCKLRGSQVDHWRALVNGGAHAMAEAIAIQDDLDEIQHEIDLENYDDHVAIVKLRDGDPNSLAVRVECGPRPEKPRHRNRGQAGYHALLHAARANFPFAKYTEANQLSVSQWIVSESYRRNWRAHDINPYLAGLVTAVFVRSDNERELEEAIQSRAYDYHVRLGKSN